MAGASVEARGDNHGLTRSQKVIFHNVPYGAIAKDHKIAEGKPRCLHAKKNPLTAATFSAGDQ